MPTQPSENTPTLYVRDVPKALKAELISSAKAKRVSLNSYVLSVLAQHQDIGGPPAGAQTMRHVYVRTPNRPRLAVCWFCFHVAQIVTSRNGLTCVAIPVGQGICTGPPTSTSRGPQGDTTTNGLEP